MKMARKRANSFYFSDSHAIDYCSFLEKLRHVESGMWEVHQEDDRVILEPAQIFAEVAIHGFRWREDDQRVVTRAYQEEPRKHAKSFRLAGAALYDLCFSGQKSPQITIGASNKTQANRVFNPLSKLLKQDVELVNEFGLNLTLENITNPKNDGEVMKLTAKGETQDGLNPSLAIMEELHAVKSAVYDVINSAFGARPNALMRMITTGGVSTSGLAYTVRSDMINILEGVHEDFSVFAIIYTLDEEDYLNEDGTMRIRHVLTDPQLVAKANHMLGVSLDPKKVKSALREAQANAERVTEVLRTRFNLWGHSAQALIKTANWAGCRDENTALERWIGAKCWIGIDLGPSDDFCSIGFVFEDGQDLAVFARYFCSELAPIFEHSTEGPKARAWVEQGFLTPLPTMPVDFDDITKELQVYRDVFDVQAIAVDKYQANQMMHDLSSDGWPVVEYPNAMRFMSQPTHDLIKRTVGRRLRHEGHPVLSWNAENVHGETKDNGGILPKKGRDKMKKIDGFVALVMANGVRMGGGVPTDTDKTPKKSVYSQGGVIIGLDSEHSNAA